MALFNYIYLKLKRWDCSRHRCSGRGEKTTLLIIRSLPLRNDVWFTSWTHESINHSGDLHLEYSTPYSYTVRTVESTYSATKCKLKQRFPYIFLWILRRTEDPPISEAKFPFDSVWYAAALLLSFFLLLVLRRKTNMHPCGRFFRDNKAALFCCIVK